MHTHDHDHNAERSLGFGLLLLILLAFMVAVSSTGCDAASLRQMDQAARSVPQGVDDINDALDSPTGQLVPAPVRGGIKTGLLALSILAAGWQTLRAHQWKTTSAEQRYARDIFEASGEEGNEQLHAAEAAALNPATVKRLRRLE